MKVNAGLVVTDGVVVGTGGLEVTEGLSVSSNGVKINAGLVVTDGVVVGTGGLTVAAGKVSLGSGMNVVGGITTGDTGLRVTIGGVSVTGGLSVALDGMKVNAGLVVTDGVVVGTGGLEVTGGITAGDTGLRVTIGGVSVTGGLSVALKGMKVNAGLVVTDGVVVGNSGVTVSAGGLLIGDGGLTVAGDVFGVSIQSSGSISADIVSTPGNSGCCVSDARLKYNVELVDKSLDKIRKLRGVYFYWNKTIDAVSDYSDKRHVGVIAQEVQAVLPEIVNNVTNDYLGVDYAFLTPLLIEGIKELQNQTDVIFNIVNNSSSYKSRNDTANWTRLSNTNVLLLKKHDDLKASNAELDEVMTELVETNTKNMNLFKSLLHRVSELESKSNV
jgi:hypothetical protein